MSKNFAVDVTGPLAANVLTVGDTASVADDGTNGANQGAPTSQLDTDDVRGTWVGTTSNDFSLPGNWVGGRLPNSGQNISIPTGGGANAPTLLSGTTVVNTVFFAAAPKDLTITSPANLTANTSVSLAAAKVVGTGTLELGPSAGITFTTGLVTCSLKKDVQNVALTEAPDSEQSLLFTYPVGSGTTMFPVDATFTTGSTGSLTVSTTTGTQPQLTAATSLGRYWTLTPSGGVSASLKFTYGATTAINGTEANYHPIRVTAGSGTSFAESCPATCVDETNNFITMPTLSGLTGDWTAGEQAFVPTAAEVAVSGRVLDSGGHGIRNTRVSLDDGTGHPMTAISNAFGYYHFDAVQSGGTYMLNATSRGYTFSPRVVPVTDQLSDLDLTALP